MNNSFFFHLVQQISIFSLFFIQVFSYISFQHLFNPPHRFPRRFNLQIMVFDFFLGKFDQKLGAVCNFAHRLPAATHPSTHSKSGRDVNR